jgi:hypothetical protein
VACRQSVVNRSVVLIASIWMIAPSCTQAIQNRLCVPYCDLVRPAAPSPVQSPHLNAFHCRLHRLCCLVCTCTCIEAWRHTDTHIRTILRDIHTHARYVDIHMRTPSHMHTYADTCTHTYAYILTRMPTQGIATEAYKTKSKTKAAAVLCIHLAASFTVSIQYASCASVCSRTKQSSGSGLTSCHISCCLCASYTTFAFHAAM